MAQHIGIVACSAEGAALCYRTICTEGPAVLGPHAHPEISMHTPSLADYVRCLESDDWDGVAELMLNSAHKLERTGADFLICPDNTIHQAFPTVAARTPLPWMHIADVVAETAHSRGYQRLALTGTAWLVNGDVYPQALQRHDIAFDRPDPAACSEINRIIMDELTYGAFKPESTTYVVRTLEEMKSRGCDAVILGCTELPLIIDERNSPLPILDSTRLLARAALARATGNQRPA